MNPSDTMKASNPSLPSLIPEHPGSTPDYWCTWAAQNYLYGKGEDHLSIAELEGEAGSRHAKELLNESVLFGEKGWVHFFPEIRSDLIFLVDDGYYVDHMASFELDPVRFPSFTGTPAERLRKLSEAIEASGWRGLGLWLRSPEGEEYMRERIRWSRQAGVLYWKVDGGDTKFMLNRLGKEEYPELIFEHVQPCGAFNTGSNGRCPADFGSGHRLRCLEQSDVMRIYDRDQPLSLPTTIDRVAFSLQAAAESTGATGIINCEDEVYVGAALGCSYGVFRFPQTGLRRGDDPDVFMAGPRQWKKRMDEVVRAVRWHRIAPPFAANTGTLAIDDRVLTDTWTFRRGDTWDAEKIGKTIIQAAPARVSRGMPLPEVGCSGEAPFVLASRHPNGAVAVAALGRTHPGAEWVIPPADVSIHLDEKPPVIGVFGRFKSLSFTCKEPFPQAVRVIAQDLAAEQAQDITALVENRGTSLAFDGELLAQIGSSAAHSGDVSDPGLVMKVI